MQCVGAQFIGWLAVFLFPNEEDRIHLTQVELKQEIDSLALTIVNWIEVISNFQLVQISYILSGQHLLILIATRRKWQ